MNAAAKLAAQGNKTWSDKALMVSDGFKGNLNDTNQALLSWNSTRSCWHGNVIATAIEQWITEEYGS